MLGTPIWPNMRVPGPRLKNPSAIPECGHALEKEAELEYCSMNGVLQ